MSSTPHPPAPHTPDSPVSPLPPDHHRDVTGGALRAGVFGAMDGLVSNFALVTGVVGGGASRTSVLLTGLAGLAAGAFSMAVGEYTSVASQREATLAEIENEKRELARHPKREIAELAEVYVGYGVEPDLAHKVARQITMNPDSSWRVHAREELGVDPDDLPSPYVAASASFGLFALGALVPMVPFVAGFSSLLAVWIISAAGLLASGALVSRLTNRPAVFGALRQLLLGAAAAAATFGIGHLVGASLS